MQSKQALQSDQSPIPDDCQPPYRPHPLRD